jgi:hypothetical protein
MASSFSDLIASAHQLMSKRSPTSDDLATALDCLNRAERMVDKARRTTITHEDFDENNFDSPSDPRSDATPDDNGEDDVDGWDDDEEEDGKMKKASEHFHMHGYGSTPSPQTPAGHGSGPNQTADPYRTDNWPTTGAPSRTSFDQKVDEVMARDGTARHIAMATARNEAPKLFADHQNSLSEGPTRNQHARRAPGQATKRAPSCYEDLVSEQMSRGCTEEMAKVRVAQLHGYDAQRNYPSMVRKSADLSGRFDRIVKNIAATEYLSLEESTREARLRNPGLYKAMRSV